MSILREWAARHGVGFAAVLELEQQLGVAGRQAMTFGENTAAPGSEARQSSIIRLDAAEHGVMLARNNVGALQDRQGRWIRYGLFNESEKQNKLIKSADFIGWRPEVIGPQHVGSKIARFVAREAKHEDWVCDPTDEHTAAQITFMNLVNADGGDARFATGRGSF